MADPGSFREIAEAYDVLSDPERRARYDRGTRSGRRSPASRPAAANPEPLVSDPVRVTGRPETVRPSVDALVDRLLRNFGSQDAPKAEHPEPLNFELILNPEEARRGVRVPFRVPVLTVCGRCGGSGREWPGPCRGCEGAGRLIREAVTHVRVPPGVRDRTRLDVSLGDLGVRNLWLSLHVRVARH